jgi:hypothetical protein
LRPSGTAESRSDRGPSRSRLSRRVRGGSWGGGRVRVSGGMRGGNQRTLALYIYFNLLGPHVSDINMSVTCDLNHQFGTGGWIKLG